MLLPFTFDNFQSEHPAYKPLFFDKFTSNSLETLVFEELSTSAFHFAKLKLHPTAQS